MSYLTDVLMTSATFEASPSAHRTAQGEQSNVKIQVMSRYKFGLAIENTREPDYMTEKVKVLEGLQPHLLVTYTR